MAVMMVVVGNNDTVDGDDGVVGDDVDGDGDGKDWGLGDVDGDQDMTMILRD